jgi:hypothetical protein
MKLWRRNFYIKLAIGFLLSDSRLEVDAEGEQCSKALDFGTALVFR